MVVSVHLADLGPAAAARWLRRSPRPRDHPGLRWARSVLPAPLSPRLLPPLAIGHAGLIAAWDDDASLDAFLADDPLPGAFRLRLEPLRVVGAWPELGELPAGERPAGDGLVAVLTLGRLRLGRALAFLRASARAERDVLASPSLVMSSGLARPPRLVATFSLWRDVPTMRDVVQRAGGGHAAATQANAARSFHHQSAFIRFRPYGQTGEWPPRGSD